MKGCVSIGSFEERNQKRRMAALPSLREENSRPDTGGHGACQLSALLSKMRTDNNHSRKKV